MAHMTKSYAAKVLHDPNASKAAKSAAASVLVHRVSEPVDSRDQRIAELEAIAMSQKAMLDEIAEAAGFRAGDTYSAFSLIDALRRQGDVKDDGRSVESA